MNFTTEILFYFIFFPCDIFFLVQCGEFSAFGEFSREYAAVELELGFEVSRKWFKQCQLLQARMQTSETWQQRQQQLGGGLVVMLLQVQTMEEEIQHCWSLCCSFPSCSMLG